MSRVTDPPWRPRGSARVAFLTLGDVLLILAFVVAGEVRHGVDPLARPGVVVDTAIPFLLAWFVAAVLAGLYRPGWSPRTTAVRTAAAWAAAALVALGLRATPLFHGDFALAFLLVSVGVGLVLLVPWRVGVAVASNPPDDSQTFVD